VSTLRRPAQELRNAIDCLPERTRIAMLEGIDEERRIIAGAYTAPGGGVCPMLAAHRRGGRTSFALFAKAWDLYTRAGYGITRSASERELRTLRAMLVASLAEYPGGDSSLGEEVSRVKASRRAAAERAARSTSQVFPISLRRARRRPERTEPLAQSSSSRS
jgi:hypothetical protein